MSDMLATAIPFRQQQATDVESIALAGERKTVYPLEGIGENAAYLDVLKHDRVVTIHSGETTMEDIFIKVTGEAKYE